MHKNYRFADLKSNLGRTMTEMLGTLAIIGVLSLAALTGYKTAMNSHKANVLLEDVRLMSTTILQTSDVWEVQF